MAFYLKTNRIFTPLKRFAWLFLPLVVVGGLWLPKLGLLLIPVMLTLAILGFLGGNIWCGRICPHGSLFDQYASFLSLNRPIPKAFKSLWVRVPAFSWFGYMLAMRLTRVAQLWGELPFWDRLGYIFVMNYLVVTVVGIILALLISPRAWCNFCPMGSMQKISLFLGRLTGGNRSTERLVTVESTDKCHTCATCARVCPMHLEPYRLFDDNNQFDSYDCIRCSTCVAYCPADILSLKTRAEAKELKDKADNRGYEKRRRISAHITEIMDLGSDVVEYGFRFADENSMFVAGQFVLVKVQEEPLVWRAYSISGLDSDGRGLKVTVKKIPGGLGSDLISSFQVGDSVELEGPMGRELVVDKAADRVVFVAGGIGITPFLPMVEDVLAQSRSIKEITLIYGVNKESEFIYREEFEALAVRDTRFTFIPVVANPGPDWKGARGFVTDVLQDLNLHAAKLYMCGPKPMINASMKLLKTRTDQLPLEHVFYESA